MLKKILLLSLPIILANIAVPMIGFIDVAIMGHYASDAQIAAVGNGSYIITTVYALFGFLKMGTTAKIGHSIYGKGFSKNYRSVTIFNAMIIALSIALLIMLLSPLLFHMSVIFLSIKDDMLQPLQSYFYIRIFEMVFGFANVVLLGYFIALQQMRFYMKLQVLVALLNLVISFCLVAYFNLGIVGVALGSSLAQFCIFILNFYKFFQCENIPMRKFFLIAKRGVNILELKSFVILNSYLFLRTLLLIISLGVFRSLSNNFGTDIAAAVSAIISLIVLVTFLSDGVNQAVESETAIQYGAKNYTLLKQVFDYGLLLSIIVAIFTSLLLYFSKDVIIDLSTSIPNIKLLINSYFGYLIVIPIVTFPAFWLDGIFFGMAKGKELFASMLLSFICFILLLMFFGAKDIHQLWYIYLCFYLFRGIFLFYYYRKLTKHLYAELVS